MSVRWFFEFFIRSIELLFILLKSMFIKIEIKNINENKIINILNNVNALLILLFSNSNDIITNKKIRLIPLIYTIKKIRDIKIDPIDIKKIVDNANKTIIHIKM